MQIESEPHIITERKAMIAYNMGLKATIYVLEKSEILGAEGRRFLVTELRKLIADSEKISMPCLTLNFVCGKKRE